MSDEPSGGAMTVQTIWQKTLAQLLSPRHLRPSRTGRSGTRWTVGPTALGLALAASAACTGATDQAQLPPDVQDPKTLQSPSGAVARYHGTLAVLASTFDRVLTETGILTDELADLPARLGVGGVYTPIDSRQDLTGFAEDYNRLHRIRAQARESRGFLRVYAPDSSAALAGHMYAVEGYAEVLLADLFCSGIPLSTVDFDGDYTLAAGSSTADVYGHAVTLFDSALATLGDSVGLQPLAAIGRGRALLALGRYADAAVAVAAVPDDYRYRLVYTPSGNGLERLLRAFVDANSQIDYQQVPATPSVADAEGVNGLGYRTSGDPRVPVTDKGTDFTGLATFFFPSKYPESDSDTLTLADGVEARLIEAEKALHDKDYAAWLDKLNHLRQTAWTTIRDCSSGTCVPGATGPLPDLVDPGPDAGGTDDTLRVNLLFRERAFWLYLTAHRQGDLRRLVRQYIRHPDAVYPAGSSYEGGNGAYGSEIVAPVPVSEQELNYKYTGCLHHDA